MAMTKAAMARKNIDRFLAINFPSTLVPDTIRHDHSRYHIDNCEAARMAMYRALREAVWMLPPRQYAKLQSAVFMAYMTELLDAYRRAHESRVS